MHRCRTYPASLRWDLALRIGQVASRTETKAVATTILIAFLQSPPAARAVTWPIERQYIDENPELQHGSEDALTSWTDPLIGISFVHVPAGCFNMGNNSTATYAGDVCVDGFFLSQYEITNAQFRRFRATHDSGGHLGHTLNDDDQPVVRVNWQDAVAFAAWLSEEIGTQIRLATEAEWEYACRYGRNGESAEKVSGYGNLRESGNEPEYEATVAVGSYEAGLQGAYDMHGNASEWVLDTYVEDADRYGDNRENPRIEIETTTLRVRRGGSWSSSKTQSSCDARDYYLGELAVPHTGFRLVAKPT